MRYFIFIFIFVLILTSCSTIRIPDSVSIVPIGEFDNCSTVKEYKESLDGSVITFTWYLGYDYKNENLILKLWKYDRD